MDRIGFGRNTNFNVVQYWQQRELGFRAMAQSRRLIDYRLGTLKLSETELIRYPDDCPSTSSAMSFDQSEYRFLVCGGRSGDIRIFDMNAPELPDPSHPWEHTCYSANKGQWHKGAVTKVQFYPIDSGVFCSTGRDCKVRLFNSETLQVIDEAHLPEPIRDAHWGMAASSGGVIAIALGSHAVRLVDPRLRHHIHQLRWPGVTVQSVQFGDPLRSPYVFGGSDRGHCVFWDMRNPGIVMESLLAPSRIINSRKKRAHMAEVRAIRVSESKRFIVTLSTGKDVHVWDGRDLSFKHKTDLTWTRSQDRRQIMEISEEGENLYAHVGMGEDLVVCNITPKSDRRPKIVRKLKDYVKDEVKLEDGKEHKEELESDEEVDALVKRRRVLPRTCRQSRIEPNYDDAKLHQGHYHNIMSIAYQKNRQRIVTSAADGHTLLWTPSMDETLSDVRAKHIAQLYEDDLSDDD